MAAVETIAPVIRTVNIKPSNKCQPFDPALLSRKLEAARREQDAANTRRERRAATRNGTFVARSATHSSDSSSTPPTFNTTAQEQPSATTQIRDLPPPAPTEIQSTADGRPVMTHKSMFAALNLGLADLEAMTSKLELETSQQREYLCSRCKSSEVQEEDESHNHHHTSRNYSRRRSMPLTSATHSRLVPVKHGSQTVYERLDDIMIPSDDPPQYHALSHRASDENPRSRHHDHSQHRPPLIQRYDRPDWTQQSQCGDADTDSNPFSVPSGYIFRRRNQQQQPTEVARVQRNAGGWSYSVPPPQRPSQEGHLISDAVKLIKAKERRAKARSVVDFLKRL